MHCFKAIINSFLVSFLPLSMFAQSASADSLLGIYYGNQGWEIGKVQALESWQVKKHAIVNLYTNWCNQTTTMNNLFIQQLPTIWNNQNVPLISWEPYLCAGTTTPNDIEVKIAQGTYNKYITNWATQLKNFLKGPDGVYNTSDDRRVYLRLAHEMNGNWYPWGASLGNNSPSDFISMWRGIKGLFDKQGLDANHVQWVWSVNNSDVGGFAAESFYPGDAYVDWIAIDGYNWGASQTWSSWQGPSQVFGNMLSRMQTISTKPIAITELASTSATASGINASAKGQWIADMYNYAITQNLKMVLWFNQDKETDWAAFGGAVGNGTFTYNSQSYNVNSAYGTAVGASTFTPSTSTNPRLLTDTQFMGQ